jgi:hypothetical protein
MVLCKHDGINEMTSLSGTLLSEISRSVISK